MARRYPLPRILPIPDDTQEANCTAVGLFCFPDTPGWRRTIAGLLSNLTYGRSWDEADGSVKDVLAIGQNIFGSYCVMCIDDILEAIDGLTVAINNQTTQQALCCGTSGGGVGSEPPGVNIEEGVDPPPGSGFSPLPYDPGSEEYQERKCKVANWLLEQLAELLNNLAPIELLGQVTVTTVTGLVAAALAVIVGGPLALGVAVVALLANIVAYLVGEQIDMAGLAGIVLANMSDLVCVLYEATTSDGAKSSLIQALDDAGANEAQVGLLNLLLDLKPLSALFAQSDTPAGVSLEQSLASYEPQYDCSACQEPCEEFLLFWGTVVSQAEGQVVIAPELVEGLWKASIYFNVVEGEPGQFAYCGPGVEVTGITTTNNLLGGIAYDNPDNTQIQVFHMNPANGILPNLPFQNLGQITFTFNTGETGQITVSWT